MKALEHILEQAKADKFARPKFIGEKEAALEKLREQTEEAKPMTGI